MVKLELALSTDISYDSFVDILRSTVSNVSSNEWEVLCDMDPAIGLVGAMHPPWSRRGRFFGAGEVRIAILSLLSEKPRHGYELMKELEARSGGSYRVSAGTMYPALQQLEDEGMIVSETKDGKRVYQLTELGRQELQRESATAEDIWRRTSDWGGLGGVDCGEPAGSR